MPVDSLFLLAKVVENLFALVGGKGQKRWEILEHAEGGMN